MEPPAGNRLSLFMKPHDLSVCLIAFIFLLGFQGKVWSCSTVDGYHPPSNYEIVKDAEFIVLGEVLRFDETEKGIPVAVFSVEEVLKGNIEPATLAVEGVNESFGKGDQDDCS